MIEKTVDIFSDIPPRRVWLGRGAGGAVLVSLFVFILLITFNTYADLIFNTYADLLPGEEPFVLSILFSFFIKSKPRFRIFDGVLLGIGLIGLPLSALLALAYFLKVLGFFLPSVSSLEDFREGLYTICFYVIIIHSVICAPVWLIFTIFRAKTVFRIYRSRFFYWSLLLFPLVFVLASNLMILFALFFL